MNRYTLAAMAMTAALLTSATQASAAQAVPIPPGVAVAMIVANELTKPKPFCRVIKVFKKKKRC
jgi:hypothetical protein